MRARPRRRRAGPAPTCAAAGRAAAELHTGFRIGRDDAAARSLLATCDDPGAPRPGSSVLNGPSRGQQPLEERPVALQGDAEVLRGDVLAAAPLLLEAVALRRETLRKPLHDHGHEL